RYIDADALREATRRVVNATLAVRNPGIWGESTTACASDSKHFGAFDQNLMTEWHARYGGRGVMIYWHVERGSICIHSRLRRCSSSEVAAMIEGVLRHDTEMEIERQYVDSHGQSEVAFAFCRLLGFQLLPRLKAISAQRLYLPQTGSDAYPHLACILTRPVDWELVEQQYDEMARYATAMAERTADPETILRRFTRANLQHPTRRSGGGGACAASAAILSGLRQYVDAAAGARGVRMEGAHDGGGRARTDAAHLGACQPLRRVRSRHGAAARSRSGRGGLTLYGIRIS